MSVCSTCGTQLKPGQRFCGQCGTPLGSLCPSCGAENPLEGRFCEQCGTPLQTGKAAPAPAPAASASSAASIPELRFVSVLFVDLIGFTALSETRESEDVRELLGRYFDQARTVIERHGGTIEKFIGDAVMAVWGVPVAREDDAERAVRAALEIVDAVSAFGADLGTPDLCARGGVVTGQVAALESPGEGLVVGDRVNTASRVQSAAQAGTVLVDEVTRQVTSAAIAYEDAGEHAVKGKAEPLALWRAVRVIAGIGGSDREQVLEAPFVGRDGDLRLVKELFHGALERHSARLVAVSGAAGIGKSRLRREFFTYVDGLSDTVMWHLGRCPSHGDGVAYWALAEMVRQRFAIAEDASADDAAAKLEQSLERWVADPADREFLRPRLGALLGIAEPGLGREELFAGWRLFFERLAEHLPVVMLFEDLQWADSGLLDFIEQLLDWSSQSPIFILTFARPELVAGREGWPVGQRGATALQLEPLDDRAMRSLLAGFVAGLPDEAAERIVEQAQGVPLYATETVRALVDRGVVAEREGRLVLVGELGDLDVPASLSSLLAARIDALEPAERTLVKAMSVFGGSFPRSAAAALGGVPEGELDDVLASLVRRQVFVIRADKLSPDRGQYGFAQGLLRTVAYETLSRQERKPRHLAAAEHLRTAFPNDGEDVAEVIAAHYLDAYRAAGQDPDADRLRAEALAALRRAGRRAATVGAPEAAERSYLAAAELTQDEAERTELTQAAGEMAADSGRYETAIELLDAAAAAHLAAGRRREAARVANIAGLALNRLGHLQEAVERVRAALELLSGDQLDPDVARLNATLGRSLVFLAGYEEADAPLETALTIAEALGLPEVLSEALNYRAIIYMFNGRPQQARYLFAGAADVAERHGLTVQLMTALGNSGYQATLSDWPDATDKIEAALALSRRRGDRAAESVAAGNLMGVLLLTGRWQQLEQLASELLEQDERRPRGEDIYARLTMLDVLRGEPEGARASLDRIAAWADLDDRERSFAHAAVEVAVLLADGHPEEALSRARSFILDALAELGTTHDAVRIAWPDALYAALVLHRRDDARALIDLLGQRPAGHVPPFLTAQLARGRGLVAAADAQHELVEAELTEAIAGFAELDYPYWLAIARTDLAEWLIGQNRSAEAEPLLAEALPVLESLRAAPALARAQSLGRHDRAAV